MKNGEPGSGADEPTGQLWPMGAVTRRTGISEHTLRAWERRFDFPQPVRLPSGHRRYTSEQVHQLLLIVLALERGMRAGDVVPLPPDRLEELLRDTGAFDAAAAPEPVPQWLEAVLAEVRRLDAEAVSSMLQRDAGLLGVPRFLRERVAPLLETLGQRWADGSISIRHEHFASQIVEDTLRRLRAPLERAVHGAPILLTTLPGEGHALGLQVVALAGVIAGRPVRVLGAETPLDEIVLSAGSMRAAVVGLSVTPTTGTPDTAAAIRELRDQLPEHVRLWVGGAGAAQLEELPENVRRIVTLDDLDAALGALAAEPVEGPDADRSRPR